MSFLLTLLHIPCVILCLWLLEGVTVKTLPPARPTGDHQSAHDQVLFPDAENGPGALGRQEQ